MSGPGRPVRWASNRNNARRRAVDVTMSVLALACVAIAIVPLGSVLYTAAVRGGAVLSPGFLVHTTPPPCNPSLGACPPDGVYNALVGSLVTVGLAALGALPLGILTGIYLAEFARGRVGHVVRFLVDVLSGVPSIVMGLFVFAIFLDGFQANIWDRTWVFSVVSGAVVLGILMVPIVARTCDEALRLVPNALREAGLALGIPRWRVVLRVVLSTGRAGVLTGALLASARAAGESAPLIMTAFGNAFTFSGLNSPTYTLPLLIYKFGTSGEPNWVPIAWGAALLLVLLMLVLSVTARLILLRRSGSGFG